MSFNIPILFEDSPFFGGYSNNRREPRNDRQTREVRRPDVHSYRQWPNFNSIFEDSKEDPYDRQFCSHRPRREQQGRFCQSRRQPRQFEEPEEGEENADDFDELSGVTENMRDISGLDGWDIPVQVMGSPDEIGQRDHQCYQHRRQPQEMAETPSQPMGAPEYGGRHNPPHHQPARRTQVSEKKQERAQAPRQRLHKGGNRPIRHEQNVKERKAKYMPHESADIWVQSTPMESTERSKTRVDEEIENTPQDADAMSVEKNESNQENEDTTEIPVEYSNERPKVERRLSTRRLSQCDPPPLADIKIARIKSILDRTDQVEEKINEFEDPIQSKAFLYISETLMKALLDLDGIESDGLDVVRAARKQAVVTVQNLVDKLENKLDENKRKKALES